MTLLALLLFCGSVFAINYCREQLERDVQLAAIRYQQGSINDQQLINDLWGAELRWEFCEENYP